MATSLVPSPSAAPDPSLRRDAPLRETTLHGYAVSLRLFVEWLQAKRRGQPTLADLTHENAAASARTSGRRTKALAKWLAEKHLYFEARGEQRLSILRDLKLSLSPYLLTASFESDEVERSGLATSSRTN